MSGELDSWTVQLDGITYRIDLDPDYEANSAPAGQGDCYSPSDLEAHAAGSWQFVGITVSPVIMGLEEYALRQSLWSVEFGIMPAETEPYEGGQHGETVIDRASIEACPFPDLAGEVRADLAKLRKKLNALDLTEQTEQQAQRDQEHASNQG